ncbi:hypothetical protein FCV25MIE_03684 [Fagus crenata]
MGPSAGPHIHNNPQSPLDIHPINNLPIDQPNVLTEPKMSTEEVHSTEPPEAHHITPSHQSQVPCTLEHPSDLQGTEYNITFPLSPKAVSLPNPLLDPENQLTSPPTPVNPSTTAPITQADPLPNPSNQTAPPQDPPTQADLRPHDHKRKKHPNSPSSTPKKLKHEDAQFWDSQFPANEVDETYKVVEGSQISISLVEETGLQPSPKTS